MVVLRQKMVSRGSPYALQMPGRQGLVVAFSHGYLSGRLVFAASVPNEHPECERVRARFEAMAGFEVYDGPDEDLVVGHEPPPLAPPPGQPDFSSQEAIALQQGWSLHDLLGTGEEGDPGPRGGTSRRTGLTLAQMQLSSPPEGWEEHAESFYPWERPDWRSPGLDFTPPNDVPSKRSGAPEDESSGIDVTPPELADTAAPPEVDEGPDVPPELSLTDPPPAPPEPDAVPVDVSTDDTTPEAEGATSEAQAPADADTFDLVGDEASEDLVAAEATVESVRQATALPDDLQPHLALARQLREDAGSEPSLGKLRYHLDKQGLTINKSQYQQLITQL